MCHELLLFYSNFLRPFLQSLYIVITRLLAGDSVAEESKTVKQWCQSCIINPTLLPFPLLLEAVNSDSFRNCIRLLRYKDILSSDSTHLEVTKSEEIRERILRFLAIQ
ncbi:unnamed protein product [Cylicostephanus goldi]|uniref:GPAT/DHAPAT C-terminal domain-containing protein n=1 Tax=Cylicostephanus goldi TaxID=71465 RepID=A0A3P6SLP7_CYLGO|nr:unnamed protein product [Cylicostephanus goldi]